MASFFRDPKNNYEKYEPKEKFGVIEGEGQLLYDDITTSYKLNLPVDYYHKQMQATLLKKDDKKTKWYIKPHHVESLTKHANSIKDDALNTHYFSHYNQQYGVVPPRNEAEESIKHLEKMIQELKCKQ